MTFRIFLVDEDEVYNQVLIYCLEREGWEVTIFNKASNPFPRVIDRPSLWILDADCRDGFKLIKTIREDSRNVPIILISERERIVDRVLGLELGCDDFLVKPFSTRELVLRARRILERSEQDRNRPAPSLIPLQEYCLDSNQRVALINSQRIDLTAKEFDLLLLFARNNGMALSREQILRFVWGDDYFGSDRVVDDLIRRMRKKMTGLKVETLYGYGYRIIS